MKTWDWEELWEPILGAVLLFVIALAASGIVFLAGFCLVVLISILRTLASPILAFVKDVWFVIW